MPLPSTPHQPEFTPEQLAHARKVAHGQQYPHVQVLRARLALVVAEEPTVSHAEAGRRCGLAPQTAYKWRRRWAKHGWSLTDAPRPGRQPGFPPRAGRHRQSAGL